MKILHLLSQKPSDTGSGVTVREVIRESCRAGHQNFLLAAVPAGEEPVLPEISGDSCSYVEFESDSLPFRIVGMSNVMPYPSSMFCELSPQQLQRYEHRFRAKLVEALEHFSPDVIHSNHLWILSSIARRTAPRIPVIATSHGTDLRQLHLCPHLREMVLSGCAALDCVLVLSSAHREEVISHYGIPTERIEIVGAGYNDRLFTPGEKRVEGSVEILYAGKLSRSKGVLWLLEALSRIMHLPWHLGLAGGGSGEERDEIEKRASDFGDRITLHGAIPQQDLAELMKNAHIFVLPSFFEGFPLVLIEALASGCVLIATALPGVKEIFSKTDSGGNTTLVPLPAMLGPDRPREEELPLFAENLCTAIQNQTERLLKRGFPEGNSASSFLEEFTWARVFHRIERVYRRFTSGKELRPD